MPIASQTRAEFLKAEERQATAENAALRARWGDAAADTSQSSVLDQSAAAEAEAGRQLVLMGQPMATDAVTIEGVWLDLEGRTVAIDYALPVGAGTYFGGAAVTQLLVTRARVDFAQGVTLLEGLVRL